MPTFQNAFISYGRADSKAFAAKLNDRLMAAGLTVWFDFEDIPLGVDYQKQIDDGIDQADPAPVDIAVADIQKARTSFDWGPAPKPGGQKKGGPKKGQKPAKQSQLNTQLKKKDPT